MIALIISTGLFLLLAMTLLWLVSLVLRDASIVDIFWGPGFVALYWFSYLLSPTEEGWRPLLVGVLTSLWGLRLALHIGARNWGKGEDFRYARWRQQAGDAWWWRSYFKVFLLQGAVLWFISWPLLAVISAADVPLEWLDLLALLVWSVGFGFEVVGDLQLRRFQQDPANKSRILTDGLWRYTRHPNYFGEALLWWGFYLFAVAAGAWWTLLSPMLMTYLLRRVSGVAMLERTLRETKPGYVSYMARTNAFIPGRPKPGSLPDQAAMEQLR